MSSTLQIPVIVEPVAGNGFRATGGAPFDCTAEGCTREEALQKLRESMDRRLSDGAELVPLQVGESEHPWKLFAGMFKDDPLFDEWQRAIVEYRRQVDVDSQTQ